MERCPASWSRFTQHTDPKTGDVHGKEKVDCCNHTLTRSSAGTVCTWLKEAFFYRTGNDDNSPFLLRLIFSTIEKICTTNPNKGVINIPSDADSIFNFVVQSGGGQSHPDDPFPS